MADNSNNISTQVLTVDVGGAINNVKDYKQHIEDLKGTLLGLEKGTDEYNNVAQELRDSQQKLNEVMDVAKGKGDAVEGSYDNLSQTMSKLKKEFKATGDAAERARLATQINDINNQLKDMDASVGVFSRNVGNYANAFEDAFKNVLGNVDKIVPGLGNVGKQINQIIPLIKKVNTTATTGLKGIKKALMSIGIGVLISALGLLIANWDKVVEVVRKVIPVFREADEAIKEQVKDNNALLETNKAMSQEMDFQARVMQAQGKSTKEIIAYKIKETQALLGNTEAQIAETNAKIASLKAHSWFQRILKGENKQIKELEESLEGLTAEQEALSSSLKKLGEDIQIEEIKDLYGGNKGGGKGKIEVEGTLKLKEVDLSKLDKFIDPAIKARVEAEKQALKEQEELNALSAELDKEAYDAALDALDDFNEQFIQSIIDEREKEERLLKERHDAYFSIAGSIGSILNSVAAAWQDSVEAQVEAGNMSEAEGKRQFEQIKALQTAEAIINTIAGAVGAFMGITKDTGGWGIAAAAAQAAAVLAAGFAQVKKIQSTTLNTNGVSGNDMSVPDLSNMVNQYQPTYTQNITNTTEMDNLANALRQAPLYVSVTDIDNAQTMVRERANEASF